MMWLRNRGFTLIELIIFIIVGAIFIPLTFVAFTTAMKSAATPDNMVKARFYAEQKMEELTSLSYINIPIGTFTDTTADNYQRSWTVSYIDSGFNPVGSYSGYKKIVISVTPPTGSAYDVSTIVTRRPKS